MEADTREPPLTRPIRVAVRILAKLDNDGTDDTVCINRGFRDYRGPILGQIKPDLTYSLKIGRT